MLGRRELPVAGREQLSQRERHTEDVMLRVRLRDGLPVTLLGAGERSRADALCRDELLLKRGEALVLTDRGRLLADAVVRELLD
jgi:coproporphyrinogen III oxidase-like Fe-S oxidoreductase